MPDNIHEVATGKLHISSTDIYTGQNRLINNFQSKKEVVDVSHYLAICLYWQKYWALTLKWRKSTIKTKLYVILPSK